MSAVAFQTYRVQILSISKQQQAELKKICTTFGLQISEPYLASGARND